MQISYVHEDKTFVASLAHGVTPEQAAAAMCLDPGSWREITPEEAAELQTPTPEEELASAIADIESEQNARLLRGAILGNPADIAKLRAIEDGIAPLRSELQSAKNAAKVPATQKSTGGQEQ